VTLPKALARFNRVVTNRIMRPAAPWVAPLALLEHTGRRSGRTFRTPIFAFRSPRGWVVVLTYGPDVDWLRNVRAAGGARMHVGSRLVTLGAPETLTEQDGLSRMPNPVRQMLPVLGCHDFVSLPVLSERPWRGASAAA